MGLSIVEAILLLRDAVLQIAGGSGDFIGDSNAIDTDVDVDVDNNTQTNYLFDCSGGNRTCNLPSCVGKNYRITIKKTDNSSNTLTIIPFGGELIDGETSMTILFKNTTLTIYSYNGDWYRVS